MLGPKGVGATAGPAWQTSSPARLRLWHARSEAGRGSHELRLMMLLLAWLQSPNRPGKIAPPPSA
eukprot:7985673-Alexandrium_andersonii.AAC.1